MYNLQNYFVFDMSVPDTLSYFKAGLQVFVRISELEPLPIYYKQATGIWLDAFYDIWYTPEFIRELLTGGKTVCLVSPELHQHAMRWYYGIK